MISACRLPVLWLNGTDYVRQGARYSSSDFGGVLWLGVSRMILFWFGFVLAFCVA